MRYYTVSHVIGLVFYCTVVNAAYLLLLAFGPPSGPSVLLYDMLSTCWCTHAASSGIRLWSCTARSTHLSEIRRSRPSALCINNTGWQNNTSVELQSHYLHRSSVHCLWWGESVEDSDTPLSWKNRDGLLLIVGSVMMTKSLTFTELSDSLQEIPVTNWRAVRETIWEFCDFARS